jgi:predicted nuclease of predicted toxin-antitoxin system
MKVLIDMNLSPSWARVLKEAGIEALHWSELGPANTPDPAIMAYAAASGYVILTNDLDFGIALAIANTEKPSVVQIRSEDLRPASIANQVLIALRQMQLELEEGALLTNASGWRRRTARSTRRLATAV